LIIGIAAEKLKTISQLIGELYSGVGYLAQRFNVQRSEVQNLRLFGRFLWFHWFDWFNSFNWFGCQPIQPMKQIKQI